MTWIASILLQNNNNNKNDNIWRDSFFLYSFPYFNIIRIAYSKYFWIPLFSVVFSFFLLFPFASLNTFAFYLARMLHSFWLLFAFSFFFFHFSPRGSFFVPFQIPNYLNLHLYTKFNLFLAFLAFDATFLTQPNV